MYLVCTLPTKFRRSGELRVIFTQRLHQFAAEKAFYVVLERLEIWVVLANLVCEYPLRVLGLLVVVDVVEENLYLFSKSYGNLIKTLTKIELNFASKIDPNFFFLVQI